MGKAYRLCGTPAMRMLPPAIRPAYGFTLTPRCYHAPKFASTEIIRNRVAEGVDIVAGVGTGVAGTAVGVSAGMGGGVTTTIRVTSTVWGTSTGTRTSSVTGTSRVTSRTVGCSVQAATANSNAMHETRTAGKRPLLRMFSTKRAMWHLPCEPARFGVLATASQWPRTTPQERHRPRRRRWCDMCARCAPIHSQMGTQGN